MWLPWVSRELGNLVHRIHDVWASGLSQVVELANNRAVVQVKNKRRSIFVSMEQLSNFCWDRLSLGIIQATSWMMESLRACWVNSKDPSFIFSMFAPT
jgi:hypothetical protein